MGRYDEKLHVTLRWRGSTNQVLCSPTGAFDVNSIDDGEREVELHIDKGEN